MTLARSVGILATRQTLFNKLKEEERTIVILESPNRILKTLKGASEVEVMRILKANIATLSERLLKHLNK